MPTGIGPTDGVGVADGGSEMGGGGVGIRGTGSGGIFGGLGNGLLYNGSKGTEL